MKCSGDTFDLFDEAPRATLGAYRQAMASWLDEVGRAGRLQRESSVDVYDHMWSALTAWAVGNKLEIDALTADDLDTYLAIRGGADDLSDRYAWRLLRLVDRVMQHRARYHGTAPNHAAAQALARRPELRFANAHDKDPLPAFLPAAEAKALVTYLSAVRPGRTPTKQPWQEVRNRAAVGLMLGAGVTPGEVRALELEDVIASGGRGKNVPWKLQIKGNGNARRARRPSHRGLASCFATGLISARSSKFRAACFSRRRAARVSRGVRSRSTTRPRRFSQPPASRMSRAEALGFGTRSRCDSFARARSQRRSPSGSASSTPPS